MFAQTPPKLRGVRNKPVCCLFADRCCGVRQTELCLRLALIALLLLHIANHMSANTPQLMDPDK